MKLHFPVSFYKGSDKTRFRINTMEKIYKANGEVLDIEPKNGRDFQLKELQTIVGGLIKEGKLENLPFERASNGYLSETSL